MVPFFVHFLYKIFCICKSKIKKFSLVWLMKPKILVYEKVIDRNFFFTNHIIPLSNSLSSPWNIKGDWMCRMKKINCNPENYYIRTFFIIVHEYIISNRLYYIGSVITGYFYTIFTARCRQSRSRWGCGPSTAVNSVSTQISSSTWRTKQHVSLQPTRHTQNLCSSPWLSK